MNDPEIKEMLDGILREAKPLKLSDVGYRGMVSILPIPYERVMKEAITLRRKKIALNRQEAIERAYDFLLHLATKGEYERSGEVFVERETMRCKAFCWAPDKTLAVMEGG